MKLFIFFIPLFSFAGTCRVSSVIGVFPIIQGMNCNSYSLYIGLIGLISASLFWFQATK